MYSPDSAVTAAPQTPMEGNRFLAGLAADDRRAVAAISTALKLSVGERLREGEILFIERGLVAELVTCRDGDSALLRLVGPESAAQVDASLSADPRARETVALVRTDGMRVDAAAFLDLAQARPGLRRAVDIGLGRVFAELAEQCGCAARHRLDQRLPSLLLAWGERLGSPRLEATHLQLCRMLGAQRTTVTTLLRSLKEEGLVASGRGWIRILESSALARKGCGCGVAREA